jgi:hypothetical protein
MVLTLVVKFWHHIVAGFVVYALLRWVIGPWEARDRLRHARARQEMDEITFAAARAMYEAATAVDDRTIDGTAVEIER